MANHKCVKAPDQKAERINTEKQVESALTTRLKILEVLSDTSKQLLDRYEAVHSEGECSCSPEWKALSLIQYRLENMVNRAKEILNK